MEAENKRLKLENAEDFRKEVSEKLPSFVEEEGLVYLGLVNLTKEEERFHFLQNWLSEKRHGEMKYMENYKEFREDPRRILPGAKQAIVVGFPYYQGDRYQRLRETASPLIAQYARTRDYHKVLKQKGQKILDKILELWPEKGHYGRVFVDSGPILERALAEKTLSGFIGKNTMFINPEKGSYLLLSEIFLSLEIPTLTEKKSQLPHCGTCQRCQVYCPTGALSPYKIDASKCLSYFTIEYRGFIPVEYWKFLGTYFFGCDICQLVCPFNRKKETAQIAIKIKELPPLFEILNMDQAYYERIFGGTPMTRAKRVGLRRNALIAMIVLQDKKLGEAIKFLEEEGDPLLIGTLQQISDYDAYRKRVKSARRI